MNRNEVLVPPLPLPPLTLLCAWVCVYFPALLCGGMEVVVQWSVMRLLARDDNFRFIMNRSLTLTVMRI